MLEFQQWYLIFKHICNSKLFITFNILLFWLFQLMGGIRIVLFPPKKIYNN